MARHLLCFLPSQIHNRWGYVEAKKMIDNNASKMMITKYKLKAFYILLILYSIKIGYIISTDINFVTKGYLSYVSFQRKLFFLLDLLQLALLVGLFLRSKLAWVLLPLLTSFFIGTLSRGMYEYLMLPYLSFLHYFSLNQVVTIYLLLAIIIVLTHFHVKVTQHLEISRRVKYLTIAATSMSFLVGLSILIK